MLTYRRNFLRKLPQVVLCVFAFSGVLASLWATGLARADDVTVNVSVIDSTPSATPTDSVILPTGADSGSAPTVTIQLTGLEPFSFVQIFAQSEPILIASGFADKYGVFKAKASLPPSLEIGDHSITASVQKLGETTAELQTIAKFSVTTSGKIGHHSGGSSSGTGGNSGEGGSSGGSSSGTGSATESPVPTPIPTQNSTSVGGVLLVGGVDGASDFTWNPEGSSARVSISLQNSYKKTYAVKTKAKVTNLFGGLVAPPLEHVVSSLKPGQTLKLTQATSHGIGQWGFYNVEYSIEPPASIDGLSLKPITRVATFFVLPSWPSVVLLALISAVVYLQIKKPLLKRKLEKMSAQTEVVPDDRKKI